MSTVRVHRPVVGPAMRRLLWVVYALLGLLIANSLYLVALTGLEAVTGETLQTFFSLCMFLGHIVLGLLLVVPFVVFGTWHWQRAKHRRNRYAVRLGYGLFGISILVLISGVLLMRVAGIELKQPALRTGVYWLHVIAPVVAIWLYWLHRLAGPRLKLRPIGAYAAGVTVTVGVLLSLHSLDPRQWHRVDPEDGEAYFMPSLARTANGAFLPAETMMMDDYCFKCHADVHAAWSKSAHRFSSFNNPAYLATVRDTRRKALERDGSVKASRFCAGCHDPVPFFSGAFDDPHFDDVGHATAQAGITCTVCHSITHVPEEGPRGNADFVIEEPMHYPFASSQNGVLQWINQQLVKARPALHKKTFLKPLHKSAEFCATCHKVHLPEELNDYKWLRGQNHYDTYLLSGVSGHGLRSFYYPPVAQQNCNGCHMPAKPSTDFGAQPLLEDGGLAVHDHLFLGANTALPFWRGESEPIAAHREFCTNSVRVDLFGLREEGRLDGTLVAPLRPKLPMLQPGKAYSIETVVRTLTLGHPLTQGTADSNELWVEMVVRAGDEVIGHSGLIDEEGKVDPWSHFINAYVLDRDGNRIATRNAEDIFVPLYNHQVPPGGASSLHYEFVVPKGTTEPIAITARVRYRKFDRNYIEYVRTKLERPELSPDLPIIDMASDEIILPVAGGEPVSPEPDERNIPLWQRWNDYGIGLLLTGRAQLRQAEAAFREVEELGRYDGPLNLARVYFTDGSRLDAAVAALGRAAAHDEPPAPPWSMAWLSGMVAAQQGQLEVAAEDLRTALNYQDESTRARGFDFTKDYVVRNELGQVLLQLARRERGLARAAPRAARRAEAVEEFRRVLVYDSENATAYYNLAVIARESANDAASLRQAIADGKVDAAATPAVEAAIATLDRLAEEGGGAEALQALYDRYRVDDNARDHAIRVARLNDPAANHAAEPVVFYDLQREESGLAATEPANAPRDTEATADDRR